MNYKKEKLIDIQNALLQDLLIAFKKIGTMFGDEETFQLRTKPLQLFNEEQNKIVTLNIDNLIQANAEDFKFKQKENEELMRNKLLEKIKGMDNCRVRADGRCEWRKMISGVCHYICEPCPEIFLKKLTEYKKCLKKLGNKVKIVKQTESHKLIDLLNNYYNRYKQGTKSKRNYKTVINNYFSELTEEIGNYTKGMIVDVLNRITAYRMAEYAFILIKNTFADAAEGGIILKYNPISTLKKSDITSITLGKMVKGKWFNTEEQSLIYSNLNATKIGNEIEFFLLVGCRLDEAFNCLPEFHKNRIFINRTKRDGTSGYVSISQIYCDKLKKNWDKMFKKSSRYYTTEFGKLLNILEIKRQNNEKPVHRLRHTFATNIYYLGAKDVKIRSHLLGHKSTRVTDDIYTDFDPAIKKNDILNIYNDLYPEF